MSELPTEIAHSAKVPWPDADWVQVDSERFGRTEVIVAHHCRNRRQWRVLLVEYDAAGICSSKLVHEAHESGCRRFFAGITYGLGIAPYMRLDPE